jgi:hypothetical protein
MKIETTPIVRVGMIGDPRVSDGRLIPYIIVDCSHNPSLEQLIEIHGDIPLPGDVVCTWVWSLFSRSKVFLKLEFTKPMKVTIYLAFPVQTRGDIVDCIISVRGLYLQSSKYGDRTSEGYGSPSILIEVPASATFPIWPNLYDQSLRKKFKKAGYSKGEATNLIQELKARQHELWFRRRSITDSST